MNVRDTMPRSLPGPLPWMLLATAVLAHAPALASYFARGDWVLLARGAEQLPVEGWPPLAFQTAFLWRLLVPLFGIEALPYHALGLLLNVLVAWMAARIAMRLGLGAPGATLSGLMLAASPLAILPVAWISATGELWGTFFALLALEVWIRPRGRFAPFVALALAGLALLSTASALLMVVPLTLASVFFVSDPDPATTRARRMGLALLALGGAATVPGLWSLLGGEGLGLRHGLDLAGAMVWPFRPMLAEGPGTLGLGTAALVLAIAMAARRWKAGRRDAAFALTWTVVALLPWTLARPASLHPHQALLALAGWSWTLGAIVSPRFTATGRPARIVAGAAAVLFLGVGWAVTERTMKARGEDGRLEHPVLRAGSVAAEIHRTVERVPRLEELGGLAVLQATRQAVPEDLDLPEGTEFRLDSPLHAAVRGRVGLRLMVPEPVPCDWVSHLGELPLSTVVFLDAGDDRLRSLGDLTNARMYAALIAVAAGQFERARHDLWLVLTTEGAEVRFAFDPQSIPIAPDELDAEAPEFASWLLADEQPSSRTVLRLFAQIYEAVRGRELLREPLAEPLRAPRRN